MLIAEMVSVAMVLAFVHQVSLVNLAILTLMNVANLVDSLA